MVGLELWIPERYPEQVRRALQGLGASLGPHAEYLAALVVYGSVARGEGRPESDLDLVVVLTDGDPVPALDALRVPFREAFRSARVDPFVLRAEEIPRLGDVFPAKLLDIQAHHDCIYGADPFGDMHIAWRDLRFRVEQELRNLELRMRRFYLFRGDDPQQLWQQIEHGLTGLGVAFEGLTRLEAGAVPVPRVSDMLARAGTILGADPSLIANLIAHRTDGVLSRASDERALYLQLMALLRQAVAYVDALEEPA